MAFIWDIRTGPTFTYPYGVWNVAEGCWSHTAFDNADEAHTYCSELISKEWEVRKLISEPVYETVKPEWKFEVGQRVTEDMPCPPEGTILASSYHDVTQIFGGKVWVIFGGGWHKWEDADFLLDSDTRILRVGRMENWDS